MTTASAVTLAWTIPWTVVLLVTLVEWWASLGSQRALDGLGAPYPPLEISAHRHVRTNGLIAVVAALFAGVGVVALLGLNLGWVALALVIGMDLAAVLMSIAVLLNRRDRLRLERWAERERLTGRGAPDGPGHRKGAR